MGDNDAAMRDFATALVQLSALQGGNGQNHMPPVTGVGDLVTVVAKGAQVPNRTFMAEARYPSAVRLPTQSCQDSAAVLIMQTSVSIDQVARYTIAIDKSEEEEEESHEFDRFAALILNHESEGKSMV